MVLSEKDIQMYNKAVEIAKKEYDGHFTLLKFTTNFRFCFGTASDTANPYTWEMAEGKTIAEAIQNAIDNNISCYSINEELGI